MSTALLPGDLAAHLHHLRVTGGENAVEHALGHLTTAARTAVLIAAPDELRADLLLLVEDPAEQMAALPSPLLARALAVAEDTAVDALMPCIDGEIFQGLLDEDCWQGEQPDAAGAARWLERLATTDHDEAFIAFGAIDPALLTLMLAPRLRLRTPVEEILRAHGTWQFTAADVEPQDDWARVIVERLHANAPEAWSAVALRLYQLDDDELDADEVMGDETEDADPWRRLLRRAELARSERREARGLRAGRWWPAARLGLPEPTTAPLPVPVIDGTLSGDLLRTALERFFATQPDEVLLHDLGLRLARLHAQVAAAQPSGTDIATLVESALALGLEKRCGGEVTAAVTWLRGGDLDSVAQTGLAILAELAHAAAALWEQPASPRRCIDQQPVCSWDEPLLSRLAALTERPSRLEDGPVRTLAMVAEAREHLDTAALLHHLAWQRLPVVAAVWLGQHPAAVEVLPTLGMVVAHNAAVLRGGRPPADAAAARTALEHFLAGTPWAQHPGLDALAALVVRAGASMRSVAAP
jgi:hypothetical protein